MQITLKSEAKGRAVVADGAYCREFAGAGPFEVTQEEWDLRLAQTGLFSPSVKSAKSADKGV